MTVCDELGLTLDTLQDPPELEISFHDGVAPEMAVTLCIPEVLEPEVLAVVALDETGSSTFLLTNENGNIACIDENKNATELLVVAGDIPCIDENNVSTVLTLVPVP